MSSEHRAPHSPEQYRPVELTFTATDVIPADRTPLTVRARHAASAVERVVPGLWDGGTTYRVRFAPDLVGEWSWCRRARPGRSIHHRRHRVRRRG